MNIRRFTYFSLSSKILPPYLPSPLTNERMWIDEIYIKRPIQYNRKPLARSFSWASLLHFLLSLEFLFFSLSLALSSLRFLPLILKEWRQERRREDTHTHTDMQEQWVRECLRMKWQVKKRNEIALCSLLYVVRKKLRIARKRERERERLSLENFGPTTKQNLSF